MNRTTQFLYICHFISSRSLVLGNVDVLKNFAKFTLFLEPIFNKAETSNLQSATLLRKRHKHFLKVLRNSKFVRIPLL